MLFCGLYSSVSTIHNTTRYDGYITLLLTNGFMAFFRCVYSFDLNQERLRLRKEKKRKEKKRKENTISIT
jgi:hypothetical protein